MMVENHLRQESGAGAADSVDAVGTAGNMDAADTAGEGSQTEKPKKRRASRSKKQVPEPEEIILPELANTGMSEAWQTFYRAVAKEIKK